MRSFFVLKCASAVLFVATLAALAIPYRPPPSVEPKEDKRGVSFENILVDGQVRCELRHDPSSGTEIKASFWGVDQARVAFDASEYWFWLRSHDAYSHYTCPAESVEGTDLIPPLRPSFMRWILDEDRKDGKSLSKDGDYEVELEIRDGAVVEQTYRRGGRIEARVSVKATQKSGGRTFPALAVLHFKGKAIEIEMGVPNTSDPKSPDLKPPAWSNRSEIGR
jgi:hypothetical protein